MPSSKDPVINRQKANEYRLSHPEWHRRTNREWARKKRFRQTLDERQAAARRARQRDPVGYLLKHAQHRANELGLPFDLAREDIIIGEVCPVLGLPWEWGKGKMGWRNMRAPSLDRIKPQLGYVSGNIRVISTRANHVKGNATISEMRLVLAYMERESANQDLSDQVVSVVSKPSAQFALEV